MIHYQYRFYEDIQDLFDELMDFNLSPEQWKGFKSVYPDGITVTECKAIKIKQFDVNNIVDAMYDSIDEGLWPEDPESIQQDVTRALTEFSYNIGLGKIEILNAKMPTVWIPTKEKTHYSLEELEEML